MRIAPLIFCLLGIALPVLGGDDSAPAPASHSAGGTPRTRPSDVETMAAADATPRAVGEVDRAFWGPLSPDQQAAAVTVLKAYARKSADAIKHPLYLQETRQMLVYTDLPQADAAACSALLDRGYTRIAELLGVEKNRAVFRGKALVFIFSRVEEYRLYERFCEDTDPGGSFGMTHCFGDGMVHMAFYRYTADEAFSHLLAHESVHAFLHRYKSPVRIPSWANEGLADALADELTPNPRRAKLVAALAKTGLEQHGKNLSDFFKAQQIDGWQYPVAETLCAWMVRRDRRCYQEFLDDIKDGKDPEQSLKAEYKMSRDKLLDEYGKSIGVKGIRS